MRSTRRSQNPNFGSGILEAIQEDVVMEGFGTELKRQPARDKKLKHPSPSPAKAFREESSEAEDTQEDMGLRGNLAALRYYDPQAHRDPPSASEPPSSIPFGCEPLPAHILQQVASSGAASPEDMQEAQPPNIEVDADEVVEQVIGKLAAK